MQDHGNAGDALLAALRERLPTLAADVATDLGGGHEGIAAEVVGRLLDLLATGRRATAAELVRVRADGAAAARAARPLAAPIDAWLSAAWVAWEHAVRIAADPASGVAPDALARLGSALLRASDDIAAALADGYTGAERALAARAGAVRRAVLDELLILSGPGAEADGRRPRRAARGGLDPAPPHGLVLVRAARDLDEEGPEAEEVARRLARDPARRPAITRMSAPSRTLTSAGPWRGEGPAPAALAGAIDGAWWAIAAVPGPLAGLPASFAELQDALRVVAACRPPGRVHAVEALALERALVADPALAAAGVAAVLGPLLAPGARNAALLATLAAWLAEGCSVTGAARRLGIAPRTAAYRMERIAALAGPDGLDAIARERFAAALLVRRLLAGAPPGPSDAGAATPAATGAAGPSR
ncbi:MAG: helix-turn-helix domain-containing protein [Chloroflexota bacterium]